MKLRNAANSAWITLFQLDGEWTNIAFENGTAAAPSIYFKDSGTDTGIYSPGTDQVAITTGGTGRLFVDSSGRVGLGTSTPRSQYGVTPKLQIEGTDSTGSLSAIRNSNDSGGAYILLGKSRGAALTSSTIVQSGDVLGAVYFQGADGTDIETPAAGIEAVVDGTPGSNDMPGRLVFSTTADGSATPTERMRIDSSGRVGIGTTSPTSILHVAAATPEVQIIGSTNAYLSIKGASGGPWTWRSNSTAFSLEDNGSERLRVDSSGRLLVGTSTTVGANRTLQVAGTGAEFFYNAADNDAPPIILSKSRGSLSSPTIVSSGDNTGFIRFRGYDGSGYVDTARIDSVVDGTPGTNDMPGRLVFSTTADGASSPTERMRITSTGQMRLAGAGITFNGDTATANELDDYEEGTWTPDFRVNNSTAGVAYDSRYGFYTKIGNVVHLWGGFKLSNNGSSTGTVTITGMPFAAANIGSYQHPGQGASTTVLKANGTVWSMSVDTSNIFFRSQTATNADTGATDADFDDDTAILFTITYQTT
jgi:hypothetical protein